MVAQNVLQGKSTDLQFCDSVDANGRFSPINDEAFVYAEKNTIPERHQKHVDRVIIAETSTQKKIKLQLDALGKHAPFILLISSLVLAGWFMLEMACLKLILSICVSARSQICRQQNCATPLCGFPAIGAYLAFLKKGKNFTSSYITCKPKEALPLSLTETNTVDLSVYLPISKSEQCVICASKQ